MNSNTCHWCHVMNRESFEDEDVAAILNENYVAIKVDREERPDVDFYYMNLYQHMNGNGGWPLNVILTPDRKMFYGATYLPKDSYTNQVGIIDTLTYLQEIWLTEKYSILDTAANIENIAEQLKSVSNITNFKDELKNIAIHGFEDTFDSTNGGFNESPKFPTPHYLEFISNHSEDLDMLTHTIDNIISGGIHDQLSGGFHRYTIDSQWRVPHFEKMLYDQVGMINILSDVYLITENQNYKDMLYKTIEFVNTTFSDGSLFYSAIDAETEEEEGKYYIWTLEKIKDSLSKKEFKFAEVYYNLMEDGNYLDEMTRDYNNHNILYITESISTVADKLNISESEALNRLSSINEKLLKVRNNRVFPGVDKKILADWNSMYIESMLHASKVLNDDILLNKALSSLETLENKMLNDSLTLYHNMLEDKLGQEGFLDDYAYLLKTYLTAYSITFDASYLEKANNIAIKVIDTFWNEEYKGFLYSPVNSDDITNQKKYLDLAYPTGYSIMIQSLEKLGKLTANYEFNEYAATSAESIAEFINSSPFISLNTVDYVIKRDVQSVEVVIVKGKDEDMFDKYMNEIKKKNVSIIVKTDNNANQLTSIIPFIKNYTAMNDKTTVYICENATCKLPISDYGSLINELDKLK